MKRLFVVLPLNSEENVVTSLDILRSHAQPLVEVVLLSFLCFLESFLCLLDQIGNPFYHFCLKSSGPLYSVDETEAATGPVGLDRTSLNGAMEVDV